VLLRLGKVSDELQNSSTGIFFNTGIFFGSILCRRKANALACPYRANLAASLRRISPPRASHRPSSGICCFHRFSNGEEIDSNQQFPGGALLEDGRAFLANGRRAHLRWAEETVTELNEITGKQLSRPGDPPGEKTCRQMTYSQQRIRMRAKGRCRSHRGAIWRPSSDRDRYGRSGRCCSADFYRKRCGSVNGPTWEPQSRN
jgi:hypothetical protein